MDDQASCCGTEKTKAETATRCEERSKPVFPKNHHRLLSKKIESRRSENLRNSDSTMKYPLPLGLTGEEGSMKSNKLLPDATVEPSSSQSNLRESLREIAYSATSWGGLTLPIPKEIDDEKKSFLPTTLEGSMSFESSMNDVSGKTIPISEDDESDRDVCHRLIVRPLTEDKPKVAPPTPNPAQALSFVQLRKQKIHQVIESAIDQYSRSYASFQDEESERKKKKEKKEAERLAESDSALIREDSGNFARHVRKKQPWNPHSMPFSY